MGKCLQDLKYNTEITLLVTARVDRIPPRGGKTNVPDLLEETVFLHCGSYTVTPRGEMALELWKSFSSVLLGHVVPFHPRQWLISPVLSLMIFASHFSTPWSGV